MSCDKKEVSAEVSQIQPPPVYSRLSMPVYSLSTNGDGCSPPTMNLVTYAGEGMEVPGFRIAIMTPGLISASMLCLVSSLRNKA